MPFRVDVCLLHLYVRCILGGQFLCTAEFLLFQQVIQEEYFLLEVAGGDATGSGESLKLLVSWTER
jgi:hypothetical protein